jgi:SAM-dependent methyltransferase
MSWEAAVPAFEQAVRDHHRERGREPSAATIATNGRLVERRAANIAATLERLTGSGSLAGLRVLEAGSGYGALAACVAEHLGAAEVLGVDLRADLVKSATSAAAAAAIDGHVSFRVADLRSLEGVADESADVAIANNSLLYLTSAADLDAALAALGRVLVGGGRLVIYQANLLRLTEPFSKAPLMHLLPTAAADAVGRATGWGHNHGRVRLVSPPGLARALRRAGFVDVRVRATRSHGIARGAPFGRFLAGVGRQPR